jgi:hypothetical protein
MATFWATAAWLARAMRPAITPVRKKCLLMMVVILGLAGDSL